MVGAVTVASEFEVAVTAPVELVDRTATGPLAVGLGSVAAGEAGLGAEVGQGLVPGAAAAVGQGVVGHHPFDAR
jgi:hypothetical protein